VFAISNVAPLVKVLDIGYVSILAFVVLKGISFLINKGVKDE